MWNSNSFIDFWDKNLRNSSNKRLHSHVLHAKWIAFVTGAENIELYNAVKSLPWILIVITYQKWTQAEEVQHLPVGFGISTETARLGAPKGGRGLCFSAWPHITGCWLGSICGPFRTVLSGGSWRPHWIFFFVIYSGSTCLCWASAQAKVGQFPSVEIRQVVTILHK